MKRIKTTACFIALTTALLLTGCKKAQKTEEVIKETPVIKIGTLTTLNMSEKERAGMVKARRLALNILAHDGFVDNESMLDTNANLEVVFFDDMHSMLMALNAGDVDRIELHKTIADYICEQNHLLKEENSLKATKYRERFTDDLLINFLGNDFSIMMLEDKTELCDTISKAITKLNSTGKLRQLVLKYIYEIDNEEPPFTVELPEFPNEKTITVAVTGDLPPMDYITPDGTPAGFNTALLAEISKLTKMNIRLININSGARATALASGTVDAVFWTMTSSDSMTASMLSENQRKERISAKRKEMTKEQVKAWTAMNELCDYITYGKSDVPEDTIITVPYFHDYKVDIVLKEEK